MKNSPFRAACHTERNKTW